jgi:hypothetical protein
MAVLEESSAPSKSAPAHKIARVEKEEDQPKKKNKALSVLGLIFGGPSAESFDYSEDGSYTYGSESYDETNYSTISGYSDEEDLSEAESESKVPTTREEREQVRFDRDLRARHRSACKQMTVSMVDYACACYIRVW